MPHPTLTHLDNLEELWLEAVLDPALEHVCDVGVLEVLLHVHNVGRAQVAALLVAGLRPGKYKNGITLCEMNIEYGTSRSQLSM